MVSFKTKMKIRITLQKINSFVKQRYVFAIILIALVLALAGSITGLSTYVYQYSQTSGGLADCSSKLNETQISYGECKETSSSLSSSLQNAQLQLSDCLTQITTNLTQCLNDRQALVDNNKGLSDSLAECKISFGVANVSLMQNRIELDELNKDYNSLVDNVAKSICCVRKAAFPDLNLAYYYVANSTILCTDKSDETLGTKAFSC